MRSLLLTALAAAALLFIAAPASAQAAPEVSLTMNLPAGPADMALGGQHDVPFDVTFALRGVVCTSGAKVTIPLTLKDKPSPLAGVRATLTPTELTFDVPAGSYTSTPFTQKATSTLAVSVGPSAAANHKHAFEVTATFAGGMPTGCQGAGAMAATDAVGEHAIVTGTSTAPAATMSPSHAMDDGSAMSGDTMATNDTPGLAVALVVVAVLGVAVFTRRR